MKKALLNVLCGILCAALIISAVSIGAVRGWQKEREKALTALSGELSEGLEERAIDAANLTVVVSRHLDASDERLAQLQELRLLLTNHASSPDVLIQADADLTALAQSLGQSLPELASVQASARDQAYISTLTRTLGETTGIGNAYESLARGFNNRLVNSPTGWIARLFGVSLIDVE
ncbi:MAG: hypothetical protein J1E43_03210 [Christensenellaceae bacterium]|nr:hypothetical protein [Christensenellaceae bacterium]